MNRLLNIKHWQFFLIMILPVITMYGIMMYLMNKFLGDVSSLETNEVNPLLFKEQLGYISYIIYPILISSFAYFLWFWSIGVELQNVLPQRLKRSNVLFKIFLFIIMSYIISIPYVLNNIVIFFVSNDFEANQTEALDLFIKYASIMIPLHLLSVVGIIYCMVFCAKTIKTAEMGVKKISADSFIGEFFLIWFSVIGIWILQPRINKLNTKEHEFDDVDLEY